MVMCGCRLIGHGDFYLIQFRSEIQLKYGTCRL
jgi:hypothetical protein